ncbi:hypothetical protein B0H16DRAFT_1685301 [Mycena metata]|uniref:Uncharacterized protein n=1 Tax=Mycena metata TaxID=1033252 RepID=A0AAD7JWZ5_9AGAR|nr:hypothetical protein B0H16DRAFT_1685301 [Mycena metata]
MEKLLTYRKTSLWLLAVYLPTLIVPWVLICVLDVRPLNAPSYNDQSGSIPPSGLYTIIIVVGLVRVLNSISGVLVVPVVGAIIAQAAVVFTQRRKPKQELNLVQLFALADRGWGSIPTLWRARATGASSSFLWAAAWMTAISSLQQPIQSALVSFEGIVVMSCADLPMSGRCSTDFPVTVAYDAEPGAISLLPHNLIVTDVASSIVAVSDLDLQPNLWVDNPYARVEQDIDAFVTQPNRGMFFWYTNGSHPKDSYFVSALPNGTTTGVLRQHAIRMNSSTSCEAIPRTSFPTSCAGTGPVETAFSNQFISLRVCVPGQTGVTPWTLSRNRQDISEELYIDVAFSPTLTNYASTNFTTKCTSGSSRGYFELGNYFNGFAYGPLLQEWPAPDVIARDFNDYLTTLDGSRPSVEDPPADGLALSLVSSFVADPFGTASFNVSAPLITAASALFGNNSFLNILDPHNNFTSAQSLNTMCKHGNIPFSLPQDLARSPDFMDYCFASEIAYDSQSAEDINSAVAQVIGLWFFNRFAYPANAEYVLDMSMYFSNRAVLNKAVTVAHVFDERPIYTSSGLELVKPSKTLAATIIVSVLIAMQLVGLAILVRYIYSVPAWTASLDALAMARIGREVPEGELPRLGPVTGADVRKMRGVDALIGVRDAVGVSTEDLEAPGHTRDGSGTSLIGADKEAGASNVQLLLGGRGLIRRGLA